MPDRPHILIFNPDQWRGDVMGHLGNPAARTPVLDEFAATDAVSFSNAFCQNPVCTPSRCSFMSGWCPHVRGHRTMFHTHFGRSLLPLLAGETDDFRDAVFCEGGRIHDETHCMETESPQGRNFLYWPRMDLQHVDAWLTSDIHSVQGYGGFDLITLFRP